MSDHPHNQNVIILPPDETLPAASSSFIRWLIFFLRPYGKTLALFGALRVARYTVLSMLPLAIGLTIKAFEDGWAYETPEKLFWIIGSYMALYGLCLFSMLFFIHESSAQDRSIRGMTLFSIRHMNALSLNWHEAQGSGGKLQRVMTARNSLKQLFDMYKWTVIPFTSSILAISISLLAIEAPLFFLLLFAGFIISFGYVGWHVAKPLPGLYDRHNVLLEKLISGVYEFVGAVRTVKAFHMDNFIERRAKHFETQGHGAMRDVYKAIFRKWTLLNMTAYFWILAFLIICTAGVYGGWLGIGAFATIFFLAYELWKTLENLVYMQDQFIEHRNGFMRLTETLKEPVISLDAKPVTPLKTDWQTIKLDSLGFKYRGADAPALHDISLSIARGEKIALIGPSGAGKSTFAKLLLKQVWPDHGAISIDDTDLRHISSADWLGNIGFVPQDVELFNMSIRDNILLDRVDTTDEETLRAALKQAALDSFIDSLPEGDRTIIGERGVKLSGGQRQRLGIARALVRKAELILFDEATSALDSLSEQAIQDAIEQSFAGKTLVVIAHRLSTVRHVDRIFVLENGKLVEQGPFQELVRQNGTFAKLWALQSDSFTEEKERTSQSV